MLKQVVLVSDSARMVVGFRTLFSSVCRLKIVTDMAVLAHILPDQRIDYIFVDVAFVQTRRCPLVDEFFQQKHRRLFFLQAQRSAGAAPSGTPPLLYFPEDLPLLLHRDDDSALTESQAAILRLFVGTSSVAEHVRRNLFRASQSMLPVLITGETGVGKGLAAQIIHRLSSRASHPLKTLTLPSVPASLVESTLFGTVRGAFTDAVTKEGIFELAEGSTLFLDEIGDVSADVQTKLLQVIENGTFQSVGATQEKKTDVRLIFATNADLKKNMVLGSFRPDLYYRISHLVIHIPPLRERMEDLAAISRHFLAASGKRLSPEAELFLTTCSWQGNVRQLQNTLERAMLLTDSDVIAVSHLRMD